MACLFRVLSGPYRGKVFPVEATRPLLIGRALEADFTIPDAEVETFHCRVEFEAGETGRMAKVTALNEAPDRQLEVDGVPFDSALLKSGDRVRIGETMIEFREGGAPDEPAGGARARAGLVCVACRGHVPELGGGRILLGEPYCVRCVDLRLVVKRDLGRYRIVRKIGRDIAEIVYLAEDLRADPPGKVALHVLKSERHREPRVLRRFLTKAAFGVGLDHPLFPLAGDLVNRPDVLSYSEEHVDWPTLADRFEARRPLPLHAAARAVHLVVDGLRFARRRGIIVGKIRPPRLYVADSGSARLKDYWLTPEVEERIAQQVGAPSVPPLPPPVATPPPQQAPVVGINMGPSGPTEDEIPEGEETLSADMRRYLAPEPRDLALWRDEGAEIRSMGLLLVEIATAAHPGDAKLEDLVDRVRAAFLASHRPSSPPTPPPALEQLVRRAVDPNPERRFKTLLELGKALKALNPLL